jgi:hypothetical protein
MEELRVVRFIFGSGDVYAICLVDDDGVYLPEDIHPINGGSVAELLGRVEEVNSALRKPVVVCNCDGYVGEEPALIVDASCAGSGVEVHG